MEIFYLNKFIDPFHFDKLLFSSASSDNRKNFIYITISRNKSTTVYIYIIKQRKMDT